MSARPLVCFSILAALCLSGCGKPSAPPPPLPPGPHEVAAKSNTLFLSQKTFDPWLLTSTDPNQSLTAYFSDGRIGSQVDARGGVVAPFQAGLYEHGQLKMLSSTTHPTGYFGGQGPKAHQAMTDVVPNSYTQQLNLQTGSLITHLKHGTLDFAFVDQKQRDWPSLWRTSDVVIDGDPEAQQVTHANLFYLLSSTYPGSRHSIPPMGLSSPVYGGHIFWDAELWMLPALIVQHPEYAKPIIDYRFDRLAQARKNAKMHGFAGAEFPWESADTGAEVAPAEFSQERHITADVAWAAWQYYLWTGDTKFLQTEGWPLLQSCADYWTSRVSRGTDGLLHILHVLGPDETAGVVDDDAYTVGVVRESLDAAVRAARLLGQPINPKWQTVQDGLRIPLDKARGIPAESANSMGERFSAKQADTLLLLHPLRGSYDSTTQGRMLDFYAAHTIKNGPAMTASIHAIVAARLGRSQQALEEFQDSYRPFERGPWDAFSEKRTTNNVYFLTGMAGCVQSVLYGFAGLSVVEAGQAGHGHKLASDDECALYAAPHLPPGWNGLTVQGIRFRGHTLTLTIGSGNKVTVK